MEESVYSVSFPATLTFEASSVGAARRAAATVCRAVLGRPLADDGVLTGFDLGDEPSVAPGECYDAADLGALLLLGAGAAAASAVIAQVASTIA